MFIFMARLIDLWWQIREPLVSTGWLMVQRSFLTDCSAICSTTILWMALVLGGVMWLTCLTLCENHHVRCGNRRLSEARYCKATGGVIPKTRQVLHWIGRSSAWLLVSLCVITTMGWWKSSTSWLGVLVKSGLMILVFINLLENARLRVVSRKTSALLVSLWNLNCLYVVRMLWPSFNDHVVVTCLNLL